MVLSYILCIPYSLLIPSLLLISFFTTSVSSFRSTFYVYSPMIFIIAVYRSVRNLPMSTCSCLKNMPHRLMYLKIWSQDGGVIWRGNIGCGNLRETIHPLVWALRVYTFICLQVHTLCFCVVGDMISQLLIPAS